MTTPLSDSQNRRYGYETLSSYTNYSCQSDCMCATTAKERSNYDMMQQQLYASNNQQSIVNIVPPADPRFRMTWKQT
jgi:hypothetical protein